MSNEIQLFSQNLPATTPLGGGLGMPASPAGGEESPVAKIHRLLRGRYLLALVLGVLFASAGAVAGFLSQRPTYVSSGLIEVNPKLPNPDDPHFDRAMSMFGQYMSAQILKLKADPVLRKVAESGEWRGLRPAMTTEESIRHLSDKINVTVPPKSNTFILITYTDDAPDTTSVAPVAVRHLIKAYQSEYAVKEKGEIAGKTQYWRAQKDAWENKIKEKKKEIQGHLKTGDDDPLAIQARDAELVLLGSELRKAEEHLAAAEQDLAAALKQDYRKPTIEDWARVDQRMSTHAQLRDDMQLRLASLKAQLGPQNPVVVNTQRDLDARIAVMTAYAAELEQKFLIRWNADGTGGSMIPRNLDALRLAVGRMRTTFEEQSKKVQTLREVSRLIRDAEKDISYSEMKIKEAEDRIRDWEYMEENIQRVKVVDEGSVAQPDKDRRPIFAAAGFLGGFALPVGVLMLIGLFDSRYRFSDEAGAGSGFSGLTLLGILPNLPDRLSDPEQAAIAAHCVHQIRTMLQINGGLDERRVFSVTSASPGDGKTSLTLALGLSYAACGTRTLLIDCDLIGAGLTSRMNVSAAEGVLEAIHNRSMLPYVRSTDIADVAILPVGSAGNLHASTLSPQALRRLIEEAEKHFEVVLIDTGPILGSIEASLVCAAADAVILTVARGQQRPMVEKSLSHLAAIGAKLAGVVFNRAQASDFERSISGVSMRSVGMHGPKSGRNSGHRFGPVARAVATQGKPDDQSPTQITE